MKEDYMIKVTKSIVHTIVLNFHKFRTTPFSYCFQKIKHRLRMSLDCKGDLLPKCVVYTLCYAFEVG